MKNKIIILFILITTVITITSCQQSNVIPATITDDMSFEDIKTLASGTKVSFYGWGGDEKLNNWLANVYAPTMKEKYNITVDIIPMDIEQILSLLTNEVQANKESGSIDMIWINGENFKSAKENNLLYGPFVDKLPNFNSFVDTTSKDVTFDFGFPIEGFEAPYGKAQFVLVNDFSIIEKPPTSAQELLELAKNNPGKITYPAPPDFTGSAFVRNIIYELCGYEQFQTIEADKDTIRQAIQPAIDYLNELEPYLWNNGTTYPNSFATLDNMFSDGELIMSMTYEPYTTAVKIQDGVYTDTTGIFQFDNGTIGNTNFIAIAKNSPNKAGAIVAINELISPEMQSLRYKDLKILPVIDFNKLSDEQKSEFESITFGNYILSQDILLEKRLPEMPASIVPIIEEIWLEEVAN